MLPTAFAIESAESKKTCRSGDDIDEMGYKQELVRGMDGFMAFTIGFTEVSAIVSITSLLTYGLTTGGSLMITWGWIITFFATTLIGLNFAEMCSVFPVAGSVYHW